MQTLKEIETTIADIQGKIDKTDGKDASSLYAVKLQYISMWHTADEYLKKNNPLKIVQ